MDQLIERWHRLAERLAGVGQWIAPLGLRLILAFEFFTAGLEKYRGENWFTDIRGDFPFPFSAVPPEISWHIAMWSELILPICLVLGLCTRFAAFGLFVLTIVAIAAVHWPDDATMLHELLMGYAITDKGFGNYKLPLIFLVMLLPLILRGAGRLSLDALLANRLHTGPVRPHGDMIAFGLVAMLIGLPLAMLLPLAGGILVVAGLALALFARWLRP